MKLDRHSFPLFLLLIVIFIAGTGIGYVFSTTSSNTFTISSGIYPSAVSYTISTDGVNCCAKNASGYLSYTGTSISIIINGIINSFTESIGGRILFFHGSYYFDNYININNKDNVEIFSEGKSAILYQKASSNLPYLFKLNSSNNFVLRDVSIDMQKSYNTNGTAIYSLNDCYRGRIQNIWIYNAYTSIWLTEGAIGWIITNNHIENSYESAIALQGLNPTLNGFKTIITNNQIYVTGQHGIVLNGASDTIVQNNILTNIGSMRADGWAHGIALDGDAGIIPSSDNIVSENWIINTRHCGIEVSDRQDAIQIIGNHIEITGWSGIYFGGGIKPSNYSLIQANYIANANNSGIEVCSYINGTYTKYVNVVGNVIVNASCVTRLPTDSEAQAGIRIKNAKYISVTDNFVVGSLGDNMTFIRSTSLTVKNNFGFTTQNSGLEAGATGITVTHGLAKTPTTIIITALNVDAGDVFVSVVGATTFQINFDGGGNVAFYWYAEYKP